MRVGFIGIGQMGRHMARHIYEAGYALTVHDLSKEIAAPLLDLGARWADIPRQVAQSCNVVFSSLPTPSDVEDVIYGENGLRSGWKPGDTFVDMSTNSPSTIRRIAEDARAMDIALNVPYWNIPKDIYHVKFSLMAGRNIIGERVRLARKSISPPITQSDLAARLQILGFTLDRVTISKIETGYREVTDKEAKAIAEALDVTISWLYGETGDS